MWAIMISNADSYDVWPVVIVFLFGERFYVYLYIIFIFRKEDTFSSLCFLTILGSQIYSVPLAIEIILSVLFINYSITKNLDR